MAASTVGSVYKATADGDTISGVLRIKGVKVVGGAGGMTVNFKLGSTSGAVMYTSTVGNDTEKFEEVPLKVPADGLYVNISAGSGTIYIYTE